MQAIQTRLQFSLPQYVTGFLHSDSKSELTYFIQMNGYADFKSAVL